MRRVFGRAHGITIAVRRRAGYSAGDCHTLDATGCNAVVFHGQPTAKSAGDSNIVSRLRRLDSIAPRKGSNQIRSE